MDNEQKMQQLLTLLRHSGSWITCASLSEQMNTSSRNVRYLISKINAENEYIISSSKGYKINESYKYQVDEDLYQIPSTALERKKYIFEALVIKNQTLNLDELAEYFCISIITLRNELQKWKKELSQYGLYLKTKNGNLYAIGKEKDRRHFTMNLIRSEFEKSCFSIDNIQQYFHMVKLTEIRQIVLGVFSKYQYYLDEYSLLTYIIHLAIRIEQSNAIPSSNEIEVTQMDLSKMADPEIVEIVAEIAEALNEYYDNIHFTKTDIMEASLLMTTRIVSKKVDLDELHDNIEKVVDVEISSLLHEIIESVRDVYSIDLNSHRFMLRFALHLKNVLIRAERNLSLSNQQFINIKNEYPFLYVIAVHISFIISKRTGYTLSEDEIAYITLHVGVILEEKTVQQEKLVCAVVAPDYYVIGKKLCNKINQSFGESVFIETLVTNFEDLNNYMFDIVISTYHTNYYDAPMLVVSPFFNNTDMQIFSDKINELIGRKQKANAFTKINTYLKKELCYFNQQIKTSSDAIETICNSLYEMNLISDTFKEEIYEHERIAPSVYNNLAITHTLSNNDISSFIAVAINENPVIWGESEVHLIFIISLKREDRINFQYIFSSLMEIISDSETFQQIIKCKTYKELQEIFALNVK